MINTILALLALAAGSGEKTTTLEANTEKSSIVWDAAKVTGTHTGTIELASGSLDFDGNVLVGGEFTVDMTTINTTDLEGEWKDKLDGHLKSDDFFGVANYATSSFVITKAKRLNAKNYEITGDITIKGITQSVTFPAEVDAKAKSAKAKITLDRTKFNVRYGSNSFFDNLGDKAINDEFTLTVNIVSGS